jgi:hypothetical protein
VFLNILVSATVTTFSVASSSEVAFTWKANRAKDAVARSPDGCWARLWSLSVCLSVCLGHPRGSYLGTDFPLKDTNMQ